LKTKGKREKSTTSVGHYVRNADLLPAVIEAKQLGKVTNKLIIMIQMIADRYSRKANFGGYSFREDMVSSAVENLCKNALKFNHEKYNNPFAFYTTAIHHSFLQFMADEKKHRNIRDKMLLDAGANPSFNFLDQEKDESFFEVKESDEMVVLVVPESDDILVEQEERPDAVAAESEQPAGEEVEPVPAAAKEHKIRYRDRVPGPVVRYSSGDFTIDPVTGSFILKQKDALPEAQQETKKKARAPRVEKTEVVVEKEVKTSTRKQKTVPAVEKEVESVAKKQKVEATATAKKTVAAKKPAVKKSVSGKKATAAKATRGESSKDAKKSAATKTAVKKSK
jgi:outer membrane biosynthesis protein TonB